MLCDSTAPVESGKRIPTPMAMLADSVEMIDSDEDGIVFKY